MSSSSSSSSSSEEQLQLTKKPAKEKKSKPARNLYHPPYFQMIKEALLALNEKKGSTALAIAKYIEDEHKSWLPANFREILGLKLNNYAAMGTLMKIPGTYKLSEKGTTNPGVEKSHAKKVKTRK